MKTIDEIDIDNPEPFDGLLLQMALDEYEVTDEAAFSAMSDKQREAVERFFAARHASAGDHIVRKKWLIQPDFSAAFLARKGERLSSTQ